MKSILRQFIRTSLLENNNRYLLKEQDVQAPIQEESDAMGFAYNELISANIDSKDTDSIAILKGLSACIGHDIANAAKYSYPTATGLFIIGAEKHNTSALPNIGEVILTAIETYCALLIKSYELVAPYLPEARKLKESRKVIKEGPKTKILVHLLDFPILWARRLTLIGAERTLKRTKLFKSFLSGDKTVAAIEDIVSKSDLLEGEVQNIFQILLKEKKDKLAENIITEATAKEIVAMLIRKGINKDKAKAFVKTVTGSPGTPKVDAAAAQPAREYAPAKYGKKGELIAPEVEPRVAKLATAEIPAVAEALPVDIMPALNEINDKIIIGSRVITSGAISAPILFNVIGKRIDIGDRTTLSIEEATAILQDAAVQTQVKDSLPKLEASFQDDFEEKPDTADLVDDITSIFANLTNVMILPGEELPEFSALTPIVKKITGVIKASSGS